MKKSLSIIILIILFVGALLLNNAFLKAYRVDLTENKVYSLSQGSLSLIDDIQQPLELTLYFSDQATKGMTSLRNYADQVESLLREYEVSSNGNITLKVVDPLPFSIQEDEAASLGLTAAPVDASGSTAYFGLAGRVIENDYADAQAGESIAMTIPFFDPSKEAFLEYDISKLIYQLGSPEPTKLTVVADLPIAGGQDPMTGQFTPANVIYSQLGQFFDVTLINSFEEVLPEQTELLMLVHPKGLNEQLLYDIDQYLMAGGKGLLFVDPHFESDQMSMMGGIGENASDIAFLESYGLTLSDQNVVLDALTGLDIRTATGGVTRHFGFLGLGPDQINRDDVTTADLESINGASFGILAKTENSQLTLEPLLLSSNESGVMPSSEYALTREPENLAKDFVNAKTSYVLAARVSGAAKSHFDAKPVKPVEEDLQDEQNIESNSADSENADSDEMEVLSEDQAIEAQISEDQIIDESHIVQTDKLNLVVFADADMFVDRFWVQQSNFFGQTVYTPFANNGDLVINMAENLSGSEGLIGVRSRGKLARPFTTVEALEVIAEEKFRAQQLLNELQSGSDDSFSLSPEQEQAVDEFNQKRIEIRQSLREVQFQLDKDIDALGNKLKLINIAIAPIFLVGLLWLSFRLLRRKAPQLS